jgi:hypothetical protein
MTPIPDAAESLHGAAGVKVVLPAKGGRAVVLEVIDPPDRTHWRFVKVRDGWLAVLQLPESKAAYKATFALNVWALPKDDDALLKGLTAK